MHLHKTEYNVFFPKKRSKQQKFKQTKTNKMIALIFSEKPYLFLVFIVYS